MVQPGEKLEDYRDGPLIGEPGMLSKKLFAGEMLPFLFHDSANIAFYMAIDALKAMQETPVVGPTSYGIPTVNMWFLTVESLVSTLYKIVSEDSKSTTKPVKQTQNLMEKVAEIDSYISEGKSVGSRVRNQLAEFATFRNTLFHDLTYVKRPVYSHTLFAARAEKMNQVDVMQAILIANDTFRFYRAAIKNVDLMPKVFINAQFDAIDVLTSEVLFAAFAEVLSDRKMTTELKLQFSDEKIGFEIDVAASVFMRYDGPTFPAQKKTDTSVVHRLLESARKSRPIDPEIFKLPDYSSKARSRK